MTTVLNDVTPQTAPPRASRPRELRIALLGLGQVGGAIAAAVAAPAHPACRFSIAAAVVRDIHRRRPLDTSGFTVTTDLEAAVASSPDVVIEVLGGLEPARTAVLAALDAGIPVVTANKSLLAEHGDELFAAADRADVPLLYEASVLAGVPFLSTFGRRPLARTVTAVQGIVNGTSNYILSRMARDRVAFADALADARRAGYAEPDPSKDVDGDDAVEKLCVLLRHFAGLSVVPSQFEQRGIRDVAPADFHHAAAFGGVIRPIAAATWRDDSATAYVGPAFLEQTNPLAGVDGVQNAMLLTTARADRLFFSGPGAGPAVTAATVLDDVIEASWGGTWLTTPIARKCIMAPQSESGWFVRLTASALAEDEAPALLARLGVRLRRVSHVDARAGHHHQWLLVHPCSRIHLTAALDVLEARTRIRSWYAPCLE